MATIYNSELTSNLRNAAKIQTSREQVPNQIADKVVPTVETNPDLLRICNLVESSSSGTTAASVTVIAADSSNDIYITGIEFGLAKDAACDAATGTLSLTVTINGASKSLLSIPMITLTASNTVLSLSFPTPLKIDRNTSLRYTNSTFTAGLLRSTCNVVGYKVYNPTG